MIKKYNVFKEAINEGKDGKIDGIDQRAKNKIRMSYMQVSLNLGFFAELLFNLNIKQASANSGVDTMATDGKSIMYNADFVNKLSEQEVSFVLIHELMHNANFHFGRQFGKDHDLWNRACDYAINLQISDLSKEGKGKMLKVPEEILLDEKYRGLNAEMIYDILDQQKKKNPQNKPGQGQGTPGQGGGQGQPGQGQLPDKALPGDIRAPGSLDDSGENIYNGSRVVNEAKNIKELEEAWRNIRNDAATKNIGTGSENFDRWVRQLNKPKINWRMELKKFVKNVFDKLDYAFSNKRFIWKGMHLPAAKKVDASTYENVVIAIDTSGSISDDTLGKFATEMMKLFTDFSIKDVTVIWCDSRIPKDGVQQFKVADKKFDLKKLHPKGGGGTDFSPPFEWVETNILKKHKNIAFFVYFTDSYGTPPSTSQFQIKKYVDRILWVITEAETAPNLKFGKKLFIDKMPG